MSPDSPRLADYEDYSRRELSRLVRSSIEAVARRNMQLLEASLTRSLAQIVQYCQDRVFRAYREAHRVNDEAEMPPGEDMASPVFSPHHSHESEVPLQPLGSFPQHSDFLETVFDSPSTQDTNILVPTTQRNESLSSFLAASASSEMTSDSGYASELPKACDCQDPSNCMCAVRSQVDDANNRFGGDEIGVAATQMNEYWSQMESNGADLPLWANI
jgi:hypothetical protein